MTNDDVSSLRFMSFMYVIAIYSFIEAIDDISVSIIGWLNCICVLCVCLFVFCGACSYKNMELWLV